jgi:hypothetical protein
MQHRCARLLSNLMFAILCIFVRVIARAALLQSSYSEGKSKWVMAHPKGFR